MKIHTNKWYLTAFLIITKCLLLNGQCWEAFADDPFMQHTMAIKSDGTLWGWGEGTSSQIGDGSAEHKMLPIQVGSEADWKSVAATKSVTSAIKNDGTLWAWGIGYHGNDSWGTIYEPTQIGIDSDWDKIRAGNEHTLAIKNDGTLWAWGLNEFYQLGDGTNQLRLVPVQIGTDNDWVSISAGMLHSAAIKENGTLWMWGENSGGQLGDGTEENRAIPTQIGVSNTWQSINLGRGFSIAIDENGRLWAWGNRAIGPFSNDNTVNVPIQVGTDNDWKSISTGLYHTLAIKDNGTLWAWGTNSKGQLGDGTTEYREAPVQIEAGETWQSVITGRRHSIGIKEDGTLWAWGQNTHGQLGDNTNIDKYSPTLIDNLQSANLPVALPGEEYYLICDQLFLDLDGSNSLNAISYEWSTNDGNIITGANTPTPTVDTFGTYTLEVIAEGGCKDIASTQVLDNTNPPDLQIIGGEINCNNSSVILTAESSISDLDYYWSGPGINETNQSISTSSPGVYSVTVTNSENNCSNTDDFLVSLNFSQPIANVNDVYELECGIEATLDASTSVDAASFIWLNVNGEVIGGNNPLQNIYETGAYTLIVIGANGCQDTTETVVIANTYPTDAIISITDVSCKGERNGQIVIESVTGGVLPYQYSLNNGNFQNEASFDKLPQGIYNIMIRDANNCLYEIENILLSEPENSLVVDILCPSSGAISSNTSVKLEVWANQDSNDFIYEWDGDNLDCHDCSEPQATLTHTSLYTVTVTDTKGCTASISKTIYVKSELEDESHVITPGNQNGENEELVFSEIANGQYPSSELVIFNRWGSVIYQAKPYQNNWRGINIDGNEVPHGTYFFILYLDKEQGKLIKGDVLVIR